MTDLQFKTSEDNEGATEEQWALAHLHNTLSSDRSLTWEMPIINTERPDFLIPRADGSTLGIEATGIDTTSQIGKDRKKADIESDARSEIEDIFGEPIQLKIHWSAMEGHPPVSELVEELTHIGRTVLESSLLEDRKTVTVPGGAPYWNIQGQLSFEHPEKHPASKSYPQWLFDAFGPLTEFGTYITGLELAKKQSEDSTIRPLASFVRTIDSSDDIRRLFKVSDKEDKISRYKQKGERCDECWLLLHSGHKIDNMRTTATWVAAEKDALQGEVLNTAFDAVWWVNCGFEVIEFGPV